MLDAICGSEERSVTGIVIEGPRQSGHDRLAIYRHAYTARLSECLRDDYPVLAATLGDERFDALCREYIAHYPSTSPSLNAFGQHMARLCASTSALASVPFWAELAAFEWALVEVTHAETAPALDLGELQHIPADAWAGARLIGSQALRLLSFDYPVNTHYQAYRGDGILLPLPAARASATAVYRSELTLWRMDITPAMARVLRALLAGEPFAQALTHIGLDETDGASLAEAESNLMTSFRNWVAAGFFVEVVSAA
jgi:hypothetical protein